MSKEGKEEMQLVFNITDDYEIYTSYLLPNVRDTWEAIDFCNKFYNIWKKNDEDLMDVHSYEYLSHDIALRGYVCGLLCGGYSPVLENNYFNIKYPKVKRRFGGYSVEFPCVIINPELIKFINNNDKAMVVMFSVSQQTLHFNNSFYIYDSLEHLNLALQSNLNPEEIDICPVCFKNTTLKAKDLDKFSRFVFYELNGLDLDENPGVETWCFFEQESKKYYKLIS